ncbi:ribosome small subunit-dependent GTPase A [Meridianimarinicoccus aquatilis]|uniref:Small ribosomal subunit biogenesis GTPase RsgA n=1 Tax=Meridianimarinicoccus aquatilis TaxID=2552766 RepID=A0A4R6B5J7_9RHOB|nr:ribosome small subunit-dependent GTPase A [Fluviibacterium aquatile]TDL91326.1 ribosome small subunit-dependent GTPase A [Fluviibacterium aquatile]
MVRDYSKFLSASAAPAPAKRDMTPLERLGWAPFFAQQIDVTEMAQTPPVRIVSVHRSGLHVSGDGIDEVLPPRADATVGDWLLWDKVRPGASRVLARRSLVKRRAPGTDVQVQQIAANIDTAFVVASCNQDFNLARLERYVALAFDAEIDPVIVLTKTDITDDPAPYITAAQSVSARVPVIALNAKGDAPIKALADWCIPGKTVAFLGSSGVGKSTLTNALTGNDGIATQEIREDDARGRHTTTHRELHFARGGCIVLDTPGMREIQLADAAAGIADVFDDIEELAAQCRFSDCAHDSEPGCAVQTAIKGGDLDPKRLERWRKLQAEDAFNSATLAKRREKDRAFGKVVRKAISSKPRNRS